MRPNSQTKNSNHSSLPSNTKKNLTFHSRCEIIYLNDENRNPPERNLIMEAASLYARAHEAGMVAGQTVGVTPMVVGTATDLFSSDIDYSKPTYFVEGGVCGFAGVVIKPARGKFVSYLKKMGLGHKHYYGGWYMSVREFGQSLARKEAYAEAFAKTLKESGMDRVYTDSRMD